VHAGLRVGRLSDARCRAPAAGSQRVSVVGRTSPAGAGAADDVVRIGPEGLLVTLGALAGAVAGAAGCAPDAAYLALTA
jgi:hypothetical protein